MNNSEKYTKFVQNKKAPIDHKELWKSIEKDHRLSKRKKRRGFLWMFMTGFLLMAFGFLYWNEPSPEVSDPVILLKNQSKLDLLNTEPGLNLNLEDTSINTYPSSITNSAIANSKASLDENESRLETISTVGEDDAKTSAGRIREGESMSNLDNPTILQEEKEALLAPIASTGKMPGISDDGTDINHQENQSSELHETFTMPNIETIRKLPSLDANISERNEPFSMVYKNNQRNDIRRIWELGIAGAYGIAFNSYELDPRAERPIWIDNIKNLEVRKFSFFVNRRIGHNYGIQLGLSHLESFRRLDMSNAVMSFTRNLTDNSIFYDEVLTETEYKFYQTLNLTQIKLHGYRQIPLKGIDSRLGFGINLNFAPKVEGRVLDNGFQQLPISDQMSFRTDMGISPFFVWSNQVRILNRLNLLGSMAWNGSYKLTDSNSGVEHKYSDLSLLIGLNYML